MRLDELKYVEIEKFQKLLDKDCDKEISEKWWNKMKVIRDELNSQGTYKRKGEVPKGWKIGCFDLLVGVLWWDKREDFEKKRSEVIRNKNDRRKKSNSDFCKRIECIMHVEDVDAFIKKHNEESKNDFVISRAEGIIEEISKKMSKKMENSEVGRVYEAYKDYLDRIFKELFEDHSPITSNDVIKILEKNPQVVLYGPPGTGKTYLAESVAKEICGNDNTELYKLIQFHPTFTYNDFVEGIWFDQDKGIYRYTDKAFKELAKRAAKDETNKYVLIIDEINRAPAASVFGELLYALEKRGEEIILQSGNKLKIPSNLYIIGTMNTADFSTVGIDYAFRRRFAFLPIESTLNGMIKESEEINNSIENDQMAVYQATEEILRDNLTTGMKLKDFMPGMSYFLCKDKEELKYRIEYQIAPLLVEYYKDGILKKKGKNSSYFYNNGKELKSVLKNKIKLGEGK